MRRFRALIKKEMIHMLRDPRTLVFIFLMPIMQLVLLGFVNNTDIRNVPTAVFNQDNSSASRALLDSFNATGYFSFDYAVYNQVEVNDLIDSGKASVGIVIPPNYGSNLTTGKTADVLVLLDGSNPTIAGSVLSAAALVRTGPRGERAHETAISPRSDWRSRCITRRCENARFIQSRFARELQPCARSGRDDSVPDGDKSDRSGYC